MSNMSNMDIDVLIDWKFLLEKEINKHEKSSSDKEIDMATLKNVTKVLLDRCQHEWIEDVIDGIFSDRNYCYCQKCFIEKH